MKLDYIDDNELVIYLYNNIDNIDFRNKDCSLKFLKNLFVRLNDYYDLKIQGYYDIIIYIDNYYGVILRFRREDLEYYNYYDNQVDMNIKIVDSKFLYLVDIYNLDFSKYDVYNYLNSFYLLPKENLNNNDLTKLMEFSKIIYNRDDILKKGKKIHNVIFNLN